jgi:hypothetical protein
MESVSTMNQIRIDEFERFHRPLLRKAPPAVTLKEIAWTMAISVAVAPFFFAAFFVIPMMGQITVGLAAFITALYLFFRRSILIALTIVVTAALLSSIAFMSIQSIKYRLDIAMFIFIALGIPVTFIYSAFVGMKIWELRGGGE